MKVVLFRINWFNIKQAIIGTFSWSKVCHAALLFKGEDKIYDASESRGNVDYNKPLKEFGKQKIIVYEIPEDERSLKTYALALKGTSYDWKGIAGFSFFNSNDAETLYCFELVLQTLLTSSTINGFATKEIAEDLRQKLFRKRIDSDDIFLLLARAQLNPIYRGRADAFNL